jgi:hypothetical protein
MGCDQIQSPLVQGLWLCASRKPTLWPSSWFKMKDLPVRARPATATTPTSVRMARSIEAAGSQTCGGGEFGRLPSHGARRARCALCAGGGGPAPSRPRGRPPKLTRAE